MKPFKAARKYGTKVGAAVGSFVLAAQAQAASLLPTDALATVATSAQDTATDVVGDLLPVAIAVTLTFAVIGWTRRGMGKAGLK
jgi:hypothetical protein